LEPFGIFVTIVEPGPFRTDFLTAESLKYGGKPIADYDARRAQVRESFEARNGKQPGDPQKLAQAMVHLAGQPKPPLRFAAGAFAVHIARSKFADMLAELERYEKASLATDFTG
jgi:NAD(P)-dependent dehydrogenase (short-subunit alcohol dehydrogenase family)